MSSNEPLSRLHQFASKVKLTHTDKQDKAYRRHKTAHLMFSHFTKQIIPLQLYMNRHTPVPKYRTLHFQVNFISSIQLTFNFQATTRTALVIKTHHHEQEKKGHRLYISISHLPMRQIKAPSSTFVFNLNKTHEPQV